MPPNVGSGGAQAGGRLTPFAYELLRFKVKQGWAYLFAGLVCALLIGTDLAYPADAALSRDDFPMLAALAIRVFLLVPGWKLGRRRRPSHSTTPSER